MVLDVGGAKMLSASLSPVGVVAPVTWSSSNPEVALLTTQADGMSVSIEAISGGTSIITSTCMGMSDSCTVTVRPEELPPEVSRLGDAWNPTRANWWNPLRTENYNRQYVLYDYTDDMNQNLLTTGGSFATGWKPKDIRIGNITANGFNADAALKLVVTTTEVKLLLLSGDSGLIWKKESTRLGWKGFEWNVTYRLREDGKAIMFDLDIKNSIG